MRIQTLIPIAALLLCAPLIAVDGKLVSPVSHRLHSGDDKRTGPAPEQPAHQQPRHVGCAGTHKCRCRADRIAGRTLLEPGWRGPIHDRPARRQRHRTRAGRKAQRRRRRAVEGRRPQNRRWQPPSGRAWYSWWIREDGWYCGRPGRIRRTLRRSNWDIAPSESPTSSKLHLRSRQPPAGPLKTRDRHRTQAPGSPWSAYRRAATGPQT